MAFQRAILPAFLSWTDKLVMIGKSLKHKPNSLPMLYLLYHLYGRTIVVLLTLVVDFYRFLDILHHIGQGGRRFDHLLNILHQIGRVNHRPLRFSLKRKANQGYAHDYYYSLHSCFFVD